MLVWESKSRCGLLYAFGGTNRLLEINRCGIVLGMCRLGCFFVAHLAHVRDGCLRRLRGGSPRLPGIEASNASFHMPFTDITG